MLAIWTRQVYLSLAVGIWLGWMQLASWHPLAGLADAVDGVVAVLGDAGNARVILFTLAVGALIATLEASGGVRGFVHWVESRRWVDSARRSRLLAWLLGVVIFIESNITVLVSGAVARPLFDRYRVSREKLAYLIDSTSAPICILIPLNAWGAYVLGILGTLDVQRPLEVFVVSIAFNFYAIAAVLLAGAVAYLGLSWGGMRDAEARARAQQPSRPAAAPGADVDGVPSSPRSKPARASSMIVPIMVLVGMMPLGLYVTGAGDLTAGSGSTAVLWAVLAALAAAWVLALARRSLAVSELTRVGLDGAGALVGLAIVLLLALALGDVTRQLGTGAYVAGAAQELVPVWLLLPLLFATSAIIAFATGTSWGTFAIMLPIAVPAAAALELPIAPFVAAVLGGGVFGDHASPISDTTIIASLAASVDHIDHVRTQLPYALLAAAAAAAGYAVVGFAVSAA